MGDMGTFCHSVSSLMSRDASGSKGFMQQQHQVVARLHAGFTEVDRNHGTRAGGPDPWEPGRDTDELEHQIL